jgi:hypothetical protein
MKEFSINDLILFTIKHCKNIEPYPLDEFYNYLKNLIDKKQVIVYSNNGSIDGYLTYYKITESDIEEILKIYQTWELPKNYTDGDLIYIDLLVKNNNCKINDLVKKLEMKEKDIDLGIWMNKRNQFKISKRRYSEMKNNCGILAFDQLVGSLNGRTNKISLDTLCKIAQDNEFLLYPMRIPKTELNKLSFPYIINYNHHFEVWEDENGIDLSILPDEVYVLSPTLIPEYVITDSEAKKVKGGKKFSDIFRGGGAGGIGGALLGALGTAFGLPTWLVPAGATLGGAVQGGVESRSPIGALTGALTGYGMGLPVAAGLGSLGGAGATASGLTGVKSAVGSYLKPVTSLVGGTTGGVTAGAKGLAGASGFGTPVTFGGTPYTITGGVGGLTATPAVTGLGAMTAGTTAAGAGTGILSGLKGALPGLAVSGMGALLPTPQFKMPEELSQTLQSVKQGYLTPVGETSQKELQRILTSPFGQVYPDVTSDPYIQSVLRQMDEAAEEGKKRITDYYTQFGSPYSSEHLQALRDWEEQIQKDKGDFLAQFGVQRRTEEINTRLMALQQSTGIDQAVLQELVGLTGLSVEQAAMKYGVDVANVQSLRQLFGTIGTGLMLAGTGGLNPVAGGRLLF